MTNQETKAGNVKKKLRQQSKKEINARLRIGLTPDLFGLEVPEAANTKDERESDLR